MATAQTFENHRQSAPLWIAAALLAIAGQLMTVWFFLAQPGIVSGGFVCLALSVLLGLYLVRRYALRLQDRIIRLEMQVRCARLGLSADLNRISLPQLIALRFASDGELGELMNRTVVESLTTEQIKRAVSSWQPDRLRV